MLRERIQSVVRLQNAGKMAAAEAALAAIPEGKVLGESALCKIAQQIEALVLQRGDFRTAKDVAQKLIRRPIFIYPI